MTAIAPAAANDPEILRTASRVIDLFGEGAWARCAQKICRLLEADDLQAAHEYRLVLSAIAEIQSCSQSVDVTRH